jgi:aminocarboxymuconate-semialdehyde decarboxylase
MRIDVHAHYWTEDYLDLLIDLGRADAGAARSIGGGGGACPRRSAVGDA